MSLQENFIFVHGTYRSRDRYVPMGQGKGWMTWAKSELETLGHEVCVPDMPTPWEPVYEAWKAFFETLPISDTTTLIGHSAGGGFLVRYLGETQTKIKKLILVSPGKIVAADGPTHNLDLYSFEINPNVNNVVGEIVLFTSDSEPLYRQQNTQLYMSMLKIRLIVLANHGHFTFTDMGTEEFPELLSELIQ